MFLSKFVWAGAERDCRAAGRQSGEFDGSKIGVSMGKLVGGVSSKHRNLRR